MRIGELADRIGVNADTIRFYERAGVLPRPARQRDNNYRDYSDADVEHLRLLIDLRRLDLPLDDASRIASWCHSGHCSDTTAELPRLIGARRAEVAERIASLQMLDARLADLEGHLLVSRSGRPLLVVQADGAATCCDAAGSVTATTGGTCGCCAPNETR